MQSAFITPYEGDAPYIFISYAHSDGPRVFPIIEKMDAAGFRIWYDDGIAPGSEWPENIADHLNRCNVFLAFLSNTSIDSPNCRREINYALSKRKGFLGVLLEKTDMSPGMELQLASQQCILRYNFRTEEDFMKKLTGSAILNPCRKETAPDTAPAPAAKPEKAAEPAGPADTAEKFRNKPGAKIKRWIILCAAVLCLAVLAFVLPPLFRSEDQPATSESPEPAASQNETTGEDPETTAATEPAESAAPAGTSVPAETSAPTTAAPQTSDTNIVLEEKNVLWTAHGLFKLADGTQNDWNGKAASLYEASALTAVSLNDIKQIDAGLFEELSRKNVRYLYTVDLLIGTNKAAWDVPFLKNGQLGTANASYVFKIAKCTKENGSWKESQWIPHPKDANAESLTPGTLFIPVWQEKKDVNGFSWNDNPVVTAGPGLYTLVIAQYETSSAAGRPGYGIALVLKEKRSGIPYGGITEFRPVDHSFGICGSFAGSNWGQDGPDIVMTASGADTWTAEVKLKSGDSFKVRADGKWTFSWGKDDQNITATQSGTYVVTICFTNGNGIVTVERKP